MVRATLELLPNELLVQILTTPSLGISDLLRCARLNTRFHSIVNSTVEIQYRLLLLESCLVNNESLSSDVLPYSQRLKLLRQHRAAINQLRPSKTMRIPIQMPSGYVPGSTYELVDGVYARGIRRPEESILTSAITFAILPSTVLGIDRAQEWTIDLRMTIHDFTMEPLMDLLAVVEARSMPFHSPAVFPVHFLTMREGKHHPDARQGVVEFKIPNTTHAVDYREYLFIIHICGDLVGVLFRPRIFENSHHLVVWNWRTGDTVCAYTAPTPTCVASFSFLDSQHILLAASHEPVSDFTFDVLRIGEDARVVWSLHPPELSMGLNIPPPILRASPCRVPPSGRLTVSPILPPGPFYCDPSPECRVFSLSLEFLYELWLQTLPHRVIGARRYTLFAPASLFLGPAPHIKPSDVSALQIPWSWWAPHTRWLDCSADPTNSHVCHTYGTRHVRWTIQSRSNSPARSSGSGSQESPSAEGASLRISPGPPSPCVQLLTFPPRSRPLPPWEHIHLAPPVTSFDPRPVFAEPVESELPYTVRTAADRLVGLEDCEGLCVDGFERIIGLEARDDREEAETLTVCIF